MILIGASGSGITQRTVENIELIEIDMGNIEAAHITAAKAAVSDSCAILYINALIGIRKSEYDLFFILKKYFEKIAVIYDRFEVVTGYDVEILRNDTCAKFDILPDNVLFISKNDIFDATIGQKVKYRMCADILKNFDSAPNNNTVETVNNDNACECSGSENRNVVLLITLFVFAVILFLMMFKRGSKFKKSNSNCSFVINNLVVPAGVFSFVLMLMRNSRIKEFIKNIY